MRLGFNACSVAATTLPLICGFSVRLEHVAGARGVNGPAHGTEYDLDKRDGNMACFSWLLPNFEKFGGSNDADGATDPQNRSSICKVVPHS